MAEFDEVIPPGQEGKLSFEIDGKKVHGRFSKTATIISNDPANPRVTIALSGTILEFVTVRPSNRVYLRGMFGERVVKELTVSSGDMKEKFEILDVSSNIDDKITYKYEATQPGTYVVRVFKNPKLPTVNTWGSLKIHTNNEQSPEKVVQVNVTTRGSIVVQPSTINFGSITESATPEGFRKTLTVFKVNGKFSITDVEFSSDVYKAEIEPIEDGKKYKVTVNFQPGAQPQSYLDEMVINTDDPQEPLVKVRLLARKL